MNVCPGNGLHSSPDSVLQVSSFDPLEKFLNLN